MNETNFNSILVDSFCNLGYHSHKIPDALKGHKRPYDIFTFTGKYFFAIEGKLLKPKTINSDYCTFNFNHILPHQLDNLFDTNDLTNAMGVLALYIWRKNEISEVNLIPSKLIEIYMENCEDKFLPEFIKDCPLKFNYYKNLFALPIDIDEQLFKLS